MLNQFYKYLSEKLIKFFSGQSFNGGERFYLQFDEENQVEKFYHVLRETAKSEDFQYQHEFGSPYLTYAIRILDIKVVVAATINNVTPDFLVTLRNKVVEQNGDWKRTVLLSVCHETLDSIRGGSSDLQKEGMPFHVKSITKTLKEEIENSNLSRAEKEVVNFFLKNKEEDMVLQPALWDFAEVLALIYQGNIKEKDYSNLGLFYDDNLNQFKPAQMRKRLEENNELFEKIQHFHQYDNLNQQLEKLFDDKGVSRLKKDNWKEEKYTFVKESHEKNSKNPPLGYLEATKKFTEEGLQFWEKAQLETNAGQRKRHIIVFNPERLELINFNFQFDDNLKKEFIHKKSANFCRTSGKKLKVEIPHSSGEITFKQVVYIHNNEARSRYEFNIAIVECELGDLKGIQTFYQVSHKDKRIVIQNDGEPIILGSNLKNFEEVLVENEDSDIEITNQGLGKEISFSSPAWSDDNLKCSISINGFIIPITIKDRAIRSSVVSPIKIWTQKREKQSHFNFENGRLKQESSDFYPKEEFKLFLEYEKLWIQSGFKHAKTSINGLEAIDVDIPKEVEVAYDNLISYYRSENLLPSLAFLNEKLTELSSIYIKAFNKAILNIQENTILSKEQKNLFNLGMLQDSNQIMLTPVHPLNIAYQLAINNELGIEMVENHILNRLHPNNLLPYLYGKDDELYKPIIHQNAQEWIIFQPITKVSIGESNVFLANVIQQKLRQFIEHFNYLFLQGSESPIRINVVQINNDEEVFKGLFNFIKWQVEKYGPNKVIPIEVALYQSSEIISAFEAFSMYDDFEIIESKFGISLETKGLDPVDMLRIVRETIRYYKLMDTGKYEYAHISFYKMISRDGKANDNMDEIETGINLEGILSSVTSITARKDYRTGFGTKNIPDENILLIETAKNLNELASNLENCGRSPYHKKQSIVTMASSFNEQILEGLYDSSYWVTFIDPSVGIDFFQQSNRNLLIIHYSDQYTSSNQYDSITVTDKAQQYRHVIQHYLRDNNVPANVDKIDNAIRAFNCINGEWLLRIIGSKGQFTREKLSIISAIKYTMSYFYHPNILWVPVSLEEILRIAGAVNLTKSEGIFSAKNLGVRGVHSDDLLLLGLEITEADEIFIHYYPVEVKIGINSDSIISKAKEQINSTRLLLDKQLRKVDKNGFKNKFFRNFFIQLLLANVQKFVLNDLWPEQNFNSIEKVKARLLNDDYQIGYHLKPLIGKGAILSFRKDATWRSANQDEGTLILELTEEDGYTGVVEDIQILKERIHSGKTDINSSELLANTYKHSDMSVQNPDDNDQKNMNESEVGIDINTSASSELFPIDNMDKTISKSLSDVRILMGSVVGSTKEIFWEYGHPKLPNRHLLISGKSGQGKTYFIQCLLMELASNGISSIIFDYTDGFKKSKLEEEFKKHLGSNLEQFLVARDKFPINPFKRNQKELDEGEYIDEDDIDIAERMKSVLAAIYNDLGIQQQNAIYQAIIRGLKKFGDKMNLQLLREELEEDTSTPAKTALSQLNPMIDKNPFDHTKNYDWAQLENQKGKVFVIQLAGFTRDVQMMITEFILWDLWYYKLQYGDESRPLPVIMDEAQNLDHSDKSPSAKILSEGRKFGWSGWYATQFLKGLLPAEEISRLQMASQKIYFAPPDNEISNIASILSHDNQTRKEWERKLASLNKGQCVVYGPIKAEDSNLKQIPPVVINITSLTERILNNSKKNN
ncbi:DNA phosphorothioation-dependent restriction protein DptH [Neobacillus cucumis]|nr:DNA phosphorothioation-dependent restriction protein DptH [Neobacillus cucumis]